MSQQPPYGTQPSGGPADSAAAGPSAGREHGGSSRADRDDAALPFRRELIRKGIHLLALIIPAGIYLLGRWWALALLVPLAAAAVGADVLRTRSDRFSHLIQHLFGRLLRTSERSPAGRVVLNGATWVLVAGTLLTLLFPAELAAPAFASFLVADAAAAVVGLRFGTRRWSGTRRTVEGSLAFAVVALACLLPFAHILVVPATIAALAGAAAEAPEWPVNDNVRVPLIMAGVLFIFGM